MTTTTTEALVRDIKAAIAELADGRTFPDLLAAIDTLAERSKPQDADMAQPQVIHNVGGAQVLCPYSSTGGNPGVCLHCRDELTARMRASLKLDTEI